MVDRGFCPASDSDSFKIYGRELLSSSNNMKMNPATSTTMLGFMEWLERSEQGLDDSTITGMADNIVFITHGHESGRFQMDLGDTHTHNVDDRVSTSQRVLDAILAPMPTNDNAGLERMFADHRRFMQALNVPQSMKRATTNVWLKSCNVGRSPNFLPAFKRMLGGQVTMIAPRHVYCLRQDQGFKGIFEFLAYDFQVTKQGAPFTRWQDLLAAYINLNPKLTFINGSQVPDALIAKWIGTDAMVSRLLRPGPVGVFFPKSHFVYLGKDLSYWGTGNPTAPIPTRNSMEHTANHGAWHHVDGTGASALHTYHLRVPIAEPLQNAPFERWPLIFNFTPIQGHPAHRQPLNGLIGPGFRMLSQTDARLFQRV